MAEVGTAWVTLAPSTRGFGTVLDRGISGDLTKSGVTGGKTFGSSFAKNAIKVAGVAAVAFGAVLVKRAVSASVTLEAQFSKTLNVMGAVADVPKKQLADLSDLAIKMGQDTVFSANDAAEAMLELAKNGISPAVIQGGALKEALTLTAAGGVSMADASTVMGNALNAFNLKGKDSASVAAALAGAANASSADISSLSQGLQQASTVAADAGLSIQETTGALAAFANAGIAGSDAGTSLKTFLANLIPQTSKAYDAMNSYGLVTYDAAKASKVLAGDGIKPLGTSYKDTYDAVAKYLVQQGVAEKGTAGLAKATDDYIEVSGIMRSDFVKKNGDFKSLGSISQSLQDSFKGLSQSERAAALNTIFGSDARRAATILTNEGAKGLAKYVKATSDEKAADKAAAAQMKGTAGAIEQRKGSIETLGLAFGVAIKPLVIFGNLLVAKIANKAVPIIQDLGDKLKELIKNGPSIGELGKKVSDAFKNFDLGDAIGKIGDAFKGIDLGDFGAQLKEIFASLKESGPAFKEAKDSLPTFSDALNVVGVVLKFAADHVDLLAKALPFLLAAFVAAKVGQLAYQTVQAISVPLDIAKLVVQRQLIGAMKAHTLALGQTVVATEASTVAEVGSTTAKTGGFLATARATVATIAKSVAEKVAAAASKALAVAQWLVNAAMSANPIGLVVIALVALVAGIVVAYKKSETFRKIVTAAFEAIKKVIGSALTAATAVVKTGIATILKAWNTLKGATAAAFGAVRTAITSAWAVIKSVVTTAVSGVKTAITAAWTAVKTITSKAWDGINAIVGGAVDRLVEIVKAAPGKLLDLLGKFKDAGSSLISSIFEGIKSAASNVGGFVGDLASQMVAGVKSAINSALDLPLSVNFDKGPIHIHATVIPAFAHGARVTGPTFAMIGEGREPENVLPDSVLHGLLVRTAERARSGDHPARSLYGDVTVVAHDYHDFTSQLQQRHRRAAASETPVMSMAT